MQITTQQSRLKRFTRLQLALGLPALVAIWCAGALHAESVRSPVLTLDLSKNGDIISARFHGLRRPISAGSQLAGCKSLGTVVRRQLAAGVEFERQLACGEHRAKQIDRFIPTPESVHWEIEIRGEGTPWSTPIETRLRYPATSGVKFWTAWADPAPSDKNWRDPLVMMPPTERKFSYGAPPFDLKNKRLGYMPNLPDLISLPLATFAEPASDAGLSIVLSPADLVLDLTPQNIN